MRWALWLRLRNDGYREVRCFMCLRQVPVYRGPNRDFQCGRCLRIQYARLGVPGDESR